MERSNWRGNATLFSTQSPFHVLIKVGFRAGTYDDPRENSTDVSVVSIQPLLGIHVIESDTIGFKTRLLWRGRCQRRELVWKI